MSAVIQAIHYYLPAATLDNQTLAGEFADWSPRKIELKTGIRTRHLAAEDECSSDLAVAAARGLFEAQGCAPDDVDFLLLCTQSPDYFLPTTACLIQDRLGLPRDIGALDFNLGCSGYVYGLGLAKGLIDTRQARRVLLLTADTYSKFMHPMDRSVRTLFGDAAAATLIADVQTVRGGDVGLVGPFIYGTDGRGARNLIVTAGGARLPAARAGDGESFLHMDGPEILNFTLEMVPQAVESLLQRAGRRLEEIDLFVLHQANRYMLDRLQEKIGIPPDRFVFAMDHCGNTVSSSIPIALKEAQSRELLHPDSLIMLVGFGVGYSWGATLVRWSA